jgi:uncharacterized protein (DUF433 family)
MKRRIEGRGFLKDLAKGMREEALRRQYDLSVELLRAACNQFREIRQRRLQAILDDIELGMTDDQLMEKYQLTRAGVGILGITAQIGEVKTIVVLGDKFGLVAPFEFQAECRWTGTQEPHGDPCAGFRITEISDQDYGFLVDQIMFYIRRYNTDRAHPFKWTYTGKVLAA